ncbi:MAG: GGDEF domain-containing protein [Lachnospiraceae bacterium]|nr:GGDEF domain-containing protein [Lachnospiraceae bacterium]
MAIDPSQIPAVTFFELFDEPFFAFSKKEQTITIYNSKHTKLVEGTFFLPDFIMLLRDSLSEDDFPSLDSFEKHLQKESEHFSLTFANNFINDSSDVVGVMIRGMVAITTGGEKLVIGNIHPRVSRRVALGDEIARDPLTGLIDKVDIAKLSINAIDRDHTEGIYIAIVDIDYFKYVNDNYGHQYGDYVLSQVAEIIRSEVGNDGLCGRIGGDEFFILFTKALDMSELRDHMQNIRTLVNKTFENKGPREDTPISVSAGLARYPSDAENYNDLFVIADYCLYLAKEKGRNRYIIYTPEKHPPLEEMKKRRENGSGIINGRDTLPLGDVLVQTQYMIMYENNIDLLRVTSDLANRFKFPCFLFADNDREEALQICGKQSGILNSVKERLIKALKKYKDTIPVNNYGFYVCNNINHIKDLQKELLDEFEAMELISFVFIPFEDQAGKISSSSSAPSKQTLYGTNSSLCITGFLPIRFQRRLFKTDRTLTKTASVLYFFSI